MSTSISIELRNAMQVLLVPVLKFDTAEYTLIENGIGVLSIDGPLIYPLTYFEQDGQLQIKRSVYGAAPYLEGNAVWLLRRVAFRATAEGELRYQIRALHVNELLARRIVDYVAGSSEASKTGPADDLIKEIVDENFVNPTDADRDMAMSVGPNLSAAPSISKAFAWQNSLKVIQSLCAASAEAGTYLGFEVVPSGSSFQVITYTGQRGVDRRNDERLLFAQERRNLAEPELTFDWEDTANAITVGGQGQQADRAIERVENAVSLAASPYARVEAFRQAATQVMSATQLQDEGLSQLWEKRPRLRFTGQAQQVAGSLYGIDYQWGDIVPASFLGYRVPCRIATVRNRISRAGEKPDVRLSNDDVI